MSGLLQYLVVLLAPAAILLGVVIAFAWRPAISYWAQRQHLADIERITQGLISSSQSEAKPPQQSPFVLAPRSSLEAPRTEEMFRPPLGGPPTAIEAPWGNDTADEPHLLDTEEPELGAQEQPAYAPFPTWRKVIIVLFTLIALVLLTFGPNLLKMTNPPTNEVWIDDSSSIKEPTKQQLTKALAEITALDGKMEQEDAQYGLAVGDLNVIVVPADTGAGAKTPFVVTQHCKLVSAEEKQPKSIVWFPECGSRERLVLSKLDVAEATSDELVEEGTAEDADPATTETDKPDEAVSEKFDTSRRDLTPEEVREIESRNKKVDTTHKNSPYAPIDPGREKFLGGE